jgi:protein-S-isoprenylcysteine O-methyltransferase Ste14
VKTLSAVGALAMVLGVVGLFLTDSLFSPSPVVICLQVLAVALMVWARLAFGVRSFHATANPTEGGLVTRGPYRFVRHPIYTAVVLFAFAGAFAHPTLASCGLAALVFAGSLTRMLLEERLLVVRYPDYADYASRTRRMIPYVF